MSDKILRGVMFDKSVRFTAISAKEMVEAARKTHNLSRVCTAALGRALIMTSMMGTDLKNDDEKVTTVIKGGGEAGNIVCTACRSGRVKGYIENPSVELPPAPNGKLDVALAVGWFGELTVIRDLSMKEPYVGRSEMISGEIAEDFANYFTRSEQTPSLVYLGVRVDIETLKVLSAGGMLIQAMPNCPEEAIAALEAKADDIAKLALRLEKGEELRDILINMFEGCTLEILGSAQPEYRCDCSRERLEAVLMSLGKEELTDMIEKEGQAELTCRFCNKVYHFTKEQLEAILKEGAGNSDERSDTE